MFKSPFKFLDSYTKDDLDIFFGRDREIEELYQKVFDSKLLLVYGVSGTGKSSLIHCGLANKFNETDWLPLVIRRGGNIIESLAAEISSASITEQKNKFVNPADFKKGVRSLYLDHYKPVFFIFDQFEELFIFGDKEERKSFVNTVKTLVESDLQCRMIFVMREEYMAWVTEFEKIIPTFFANRVRIEKMSHLNALEAIKEPCKVFNISLEDGFAEALLEKLSPEGADVELTYLQVFLDKIFRLATTDLPPSQGGKEGGLVVSKGRLSFTLSLLSQVGNVSDLLGSFLEEQLKALDDPDIGLAILKSFVSVKGSRRQINPEEVSEYAQTLGQALKESVITGILQTFINLRILRDKDENGKYELRHDALAMKIYEKITLVEKELLEVRQFIENSFNNYQRRKILLSSSDLSYISLYEDKMYLSGVFSQFIEQSRHELNLAKRRKRIIAFSAVVILLLVFSGFTLWALKEKKKAEVAGIRQLESILKLNENFEKVRISQIKRKDEIYQLFEMSYMTHPFKLKELWDKALAIKKASDELNEFIYQLEYKMLSESENISLDSAQNIGLAVIKNKSAIQIPHQILLEPDEYTGISNISFLKQKIQNYRKTVYDQIERKDWDKINFNIETEKSLLNAKGDSVTWENANFGETILASAITNLNNLITEINYIELDVITFLYSWISMQSFSFNKIQPLIIPQNNYVILGSNYNARLMLSAFDTRSNMEAYIFEGDDTLTEADLENTSKLVPHISDGGEFNFKLRAKTLGRQKFYGFISVRTPNGSSNSYNFSSEYVVGNSNIVINPIGYNVLYRGIDNVIDVSVPGVTPKNMKYTVTNGFLTRNDNGQFSFRSGQGNTTTFSFQAYIDDAVVSFPPIQFRLIDTPDPLVSIGGNRGGKISISNLLASNGIDARLENFYYELIYEIVGFSVIIINPTGTNIETTKGSVFSMKQKSLISKLIPGDYLFIKDISVLGPEGKMRDLNDMIFTIIE